MFINNNLIDYVVRTHRMVTLSACESELVTLCDCAASVKYYVDLLSELGFSTTVTLKVYCDNQATIALVKGEGNRRLRSRHFAIKAQFVRELIQDEVLDVLYVPTAQNVADLWTKALAEEPFSRFRDQMVQ